MNSLVKEVAFIAVGQAGSNIGALFEEAGHTVLYISTSPVDLKALPEGTKHKFLIKNAEGSARDRDRAKQAAVEAWDDINEVIAKTIEEQIVYMIFSAGGGTGSGASPMLLHHLTSEYPNRLIGAITILPTLTESRRVLFNASECIRELKDIESSAKLILDNSKVTDKMQLNTAFVDLFSTYLSLSLHANKHGALDFADLKEPLSYDGCAVITKNQRQATTKEVIDTINSNIFASLENDKIVECILTSVSSNIDAGAIESHIGSPDITFTGFNDKETICFFSGLSYPEKRLKEIGEQIDKIDASRQEQREKKPTIELAAIKASPEKKRKKPISKDDLFARYMKKKTVD